MMQTTIWIPAVTFFGTLLAICLIVLAGRYMGKPQFRNPCPRRWPSVLLGWAIVSLSSFAVYNFSKYVLELNGEPLQAPLIFSLLLAGVVAGATMAATTKRVAFVESLWVTTAISVWAVLLSDSLESMFTYATSSAYYGALLLASYLLLILGLLFGGAIGYLFFGDGKFTLSFSFEQWMGRRFLMAKRSSRAISVISLISTVAVMFGCAGMIIVMSVMNGFSTDLRSKILGANAHILLLKIGNDFSEHETLLKDTRGIDGVVGASPFILNEVMVSSETNLSGAVIKGIDPKTVSDVSSLSENIIDGDLLHLLDASKIPSQTPTYPGGAKGLSNSQTDKLAAAIAKAREDDSDESRLELQGIVIGKEMALSLRATIGDVVNVVSPIGELGPTGPVPKAKAFRVAAIFYSGMFEYDSKFAYVSIAAAQDFFGMGDSVTGVEYKLEKIEQTQRAAREIHNASGGHPFYTKDWMQMNRNLFSALKLEKIAMFIILLALIFMASLLILVALIMVVIEKGKEIAILKSMGATDTSIMKVFVTYGLIIGCIGAGLGLLLGVSMCAIIQVFGIGLDPEVYYITHVPILIDPFEIMLVSVGAVVISFFATIPPSLYAARLKPVEGLRYE